MEGKYAFTIASFLLVLFVSGCIGGETMPPAGDGTQAECKSPKKTIGDVCCYDENENDVCDIEEAACPGTCDDNNPCTIDRCSLETDFECEHETVSPCCGNGVCDSSEEVNNICPEDCEILDITDFEYFRTPDFKDDDKFVFIHTASVVSEYKYFSVNITASEGDMRNIRYTFQCNSSHKDLDSIDSEVENVTDEEDDDEDLGKVNLLENDHYIIKTYFHMSGTPAYRLTITNLDDGYATKFYFRIKKKDAQKRDDLSCIFKFYFMQPKKIVHKTLRISYI